MARPLQRVVVLGAGVMGARLAAHCANHGLQVALLDVDAARAEAGLKAARSGRPAAFFVPEVARLIHTGSFTEARAGVSEADWVVEAVVENLAVKQELLQAITRWLGPDAMLSSNTSGLPISAIGAVLPREMRRRWLGTHFFNPPRYMSLVEIVPGGESDTAAVDWLAQQLDLRLGKGIVFARDTPNFIANRIGLFALMNTLRLMEEHRLGIEEVDALTGPLLGWPKSATFRTLDLIGLDTLVNVVRHSRELLDGDEARDLFRVPPYIDTMVARGLLGEKAGGGFYRRDGDRILALDLATLEYHPRRKPALPFADMAGAMRESGFVREALDGLFQYCHRRLGEITDVAEDVDRAMRWGYNWQWGPFELEGMRGGAAPPRKSLGRSVRGNAGCSLLDLGDGIGCFEFHSKMNAIGGDAVGLIIAALAERDASFDAFVISNGAENFSVGADLLYLLALIHGEEWDAVDGAVRGFQQMNLAIKRSPRPVVVAPFGMTLGGGCEILLHGARAVAHAELYAGLVEVGVGLIPAGGGTTQMALRCDARTAFEAIALARVSTSAEEARRLHFLRDGDLLVANRERVLLAAKREALQLVATGYAPPPPPRLIAPGPSVASTLQLGAYLLREAERISDYDLKIAGKLIHVICGGGVPQGTELGEEEMLRLEREAFLELCSETKTQERMAAMLQTGKPLRN